MKEKLTIITWLLFPLLGFSSNALSQWVRTSGPAGRDISCFAVNGTDLYAGSYGNGVSAFLSTDDGNTWKSLGLMNAYTHALLVSGTTLFAGTDDGIFASGDSGKGWIDASNGLLPPIGLQITSLVSMGSYLIAGTYGSLYSSDNNGASWSFSGFALEHIPQSLAVIGSELFVGGGGMLRSADTGMNWTTIDNGLPDSTNTNVWALLADGSDLYAGLYGFGVFRSSDSGASWSSGNTGLSNLFITSLAKSGNDLFAASYNGIFLSTDKGINWTQINSGLADMEVNALVVKGKYLFAGTQSNGVWRRPLSDFGNNSVEKPNQPGLDLSLSPNPTTGIITVHNAPANILHVTVSSILGESVIKLANPNAPDFTLDLSKLPPGTYVARFSLPDEVITRKIMKE